MTSAARNYSNSRTATGSLVFVSGQIPLDAHGSLAGQTMAEQANTVLDNIEDVLVRSGAALGDLVKVTYYVTDMSQLDDLRAVLASRLPQPRPAATLVGVQSLIDPRFLIEIDAVASV
ncbi:MAG: RidA family protein [Pseudonocardiales bacterium]